MNNTSIELEIYHTQLASFQSLMDVRFPFDILSRQTKSLVSPKPAGEVFK